MEIIDLTQETESPSHGDKTGPVIHLDITSPPPSKKLKQARLPFMKLSPKAVCVSPGQITPSPNQKKRKLSDPGIELQQPQKTARNDKNSPKVVSVQKKPRTDDNAENEATPLADAERLAKISGSGKKNEATKQQQEQDRIDMIKQKEEAIKQKEEAIKQREEAIKQREEAQAEKDKQKKEEREKKEQQRLEAKKKKDEEKLKEKLKVLEQKQKEKEEKLRQKEEEKQKKLQEKEEEKKKKQELLDAKNVDSKKKKEEKQNAEDGEKTKKEKEKNFQKTKKEKEKKLFSSFFTKSETQLSKPVIESQKGRFIAFEVKKDMRIAPLIRVGEKTQGEKMVKIDELLHTESSPPDLYLDELKQKKFKPGTCGKTWPWSYEDDVMVVDAPEEKESTYTLRAKLLKFHENHRPAYYGTWRKKSKYVNPRNPMCKDEDLLDYEVDSDDEWEEEEPGESLSNSEGEGSDDEKDPNVDANADADADADEEDEDGFFVPHGYLSEGEGCEDDDDEISPERLKARQLAKAKAWDVEQSAGKKCQILKPVCIGCCWWGLDTTYERDPTWEKLKAFTAVPMVPTPIPTQTIQTDSPSINSDQKKKKDRACKLMPVPKEALPDLIRLLHGNVSSIQKLAKEFREYWKRKCLGLSLINTDDDADSEPTQSEVPTAMELDSANQSEAMDTSQSESVKDDQKYAISKRQFDVKIREIAIYEKRTDAFKKCCWYVNNDVLEAHGLSDLPVPTKWHWLTRPNVAEPPTKKLEVGTPQQSASKPAIKTPNIKQFAVLGYTPPILASPAPPKTPSDKSIIKTPSEKTTPNILIALLTTPKSSQRPSSILETPKRDSQGKPLAPSALFSPEVVPCESTPKAIVTVHNKEVSFTPKDKNQRSLISMFSPSAKKENK